MPAGAAKLPPPPLPLCLPTSCAWAPGGVTALAHASPGPCCRPCTVPRVSPGLSQGLVDGARGLDACARGPLFATWRGAPPLLAPGLSPGSQGPDFAPPVRASPDHACLRHQRHGLTTSGVPVLVTLAVVHSVAAGLRVGVPFPISVSCVVRCDMCWPSCRTASVMPFGLM